MERYPRGVFVVNGESDDLMRVSLQGIHEEFVDVDSTLTLGGPQLAKTELTAETEENLTALIEANDVQSLVIDHCDIIGPASTGIKINFTKSSRGQTVVSVSSSKIRACHGTGVLIQGKQFCHIIMDDNDVSYNLYGIVIDSPSSFCLEKNIITFNISSGLVAMNTSEGSKLLRSCVTHNGMNGVFLNKVNAVIGKVLFPTIVVGVLCAGLKAIYI